jgi:hypothetical protein
MTKRPYQNDDSGYTLPDADKPNRSHVGTIYEDMQRLRNDISSVHSTLQDIEKTKRKKQKRAYTKPVSTNPNPVHDSTNTDTSMVGRIFWALMSMAGPPVVAFGVGLLSKHLNERHEQNVRTVADRSVDSKDIHDSAKNNTNHVPVDIPSKKVEEKTEEKVMIIHKPRSDASQIYK